MFYHQATGYVPITTAAYEKAKADGYYKAHPSREYGEFFSVLWAIIESSKQDVFKGQLATRSLKPLIARIEQLINGAVLRPRNDLPTQFIVGGMQ